VRYLVGGLLCLLDLAVGAFVGVAAGTGAAKIPYLLTGEHSRPNLEFALGVIAFLVIFQLVTGFLIKLQVRFFKKSFTPCTHCLSFTRVGATRCPYCHGELGSPA
jgi:hypothetical protein